MMEDKLHQMKKLASYVRDNNPDSKECNRINKIFQKLKNEVAELDQYSQEQQDNLLVRRSRIIKKLEKMLE